MLTGKPPDKNTSFFPQGHITAARALAENVKQAKQATLIRTYVRLELKVVAIPIALCATKFCIKLSRIIYIKLSK
jgi:hypothetical protein